MRAYSSYDYPEDKSRCVVSVHDGGRYVQFHQRHESGTGRKRVGASTEAEGRSVPSKNAENTGLGGQG